MSYSDAFYHNLFVSVIGKLYNMPMWQFMAHKDLRRYES